MSTNKKVLTIIIGMMLSVSFLSIVIFIYNFKEYSIKNTTEKAISIAQNVRDGLTSHMVNGTMDKRDLFLSNIANNQKIDNFHLYRAPSVVDEYGIGYVNETVASDIEKKALETSSIQTELFESINEVTLKVSIPYIASSLSNPNCIICHTKAQNGDVLGVISMDLEVSSTRTEGIKIALKILFMVVVLVIIAIFVVNHFIKPYVKLFDDLENGISQAYRGDFTYKIDTTLTNEAGEVAKRLNELSEIYKFKKTIESDENKTEIYNRIIQILELKCNINNFMLFEINNQSQERKIIHNSIDENLVDLNKDAQKCRAFRISSNVSSSDFENICLNCNQESDKYVCLYYNIHDEYSLVIHIQAKNTKELSRIKEYTLIINNYLDMAKPVIEGKILMEQLKQTTLIDPMTSLYNRRFLTELLDSNIPNRTSSEHIHSVLMIDIDFFKQVNDTYGHDVGDTVIKSLSMTMTDSIRDSDMAVRYGGEEFLILLLNTTKEQTSIIAKNIKEKFSALEFISESEKFKKTLSIGISHYPNDTDSLWKAIKFADEALYLAKNTGRDKIVIFESTVHKPIEN